MKRLLRGLGSSHDAARQGFGLALSAALAKVPEVESLPALDMLDEALQVSKSTKVSKHQVCSRPYVCTLLGCASLRALFSGGSEECQRMHGGYPPPAM